MPPNSSAAAGDLQAALRLDDPADVGGVALAEIGDHALLEGVELTAELLGLLGGHRDGLAGDGFRDGLLLRREVVTVMSISFRLERDVDVTDGGGHADLHVLLPQRSTPRR